MAVNSKLPAQGIRPAPPMVARDEVAVVNAGAFIKAAREAKGLSLRAFAKSVGLSATYMSRVERGGPDSKLTEASILAISRVLGVDSHQLYCLAGRMPSALQRRILTSTTHLQAALQAMDQLP